jgi:glutathione S-transferase
VEVQRKGRYDRNAFASCIFAIAAVLASGLWLLGTALACAAIAFALVSRKATRADDNLRGAGLALTGFLVGVAVLLFATVGPSLLSLFLFTIAPPPQ